MEEDLKVKLIFKKGTGFKWIQWLEKFGTSPDRSLSFYWKIKLYFNWESQDQNRDQWHGFKNILLFYIDFKILICDNYVEQHHMWVLVWDQMLFL